MQEIRAAGNSKEKVSVNLLSHACKHPIHNSYSTNNVNKQNQPVVLLNRIPYRNIEMSSQKTLSVGITEYEQQQEDDAELAEIQDDSNVQLPKMITFRSDRQESEVKGAKVFQNISKLLVVNRN